MLNLYQKDLLKLAASATGHGSRSDLSKTIFAAQTPSDSPSGITASEIYDSIISLEHRNPLCGDKIIIHVYLDEGNMNVSALSHETEACVLCQASATILSQNATGLNYETTVLIKETIVSKLIEKTLDDVSGWPDTKWHDYKNFHPVSDHKNRHTCVTLPLEAIIKLLKPHK